MKRFLKWLLLLTVALAASVVVLVYNPGLVKGPLERYLSELAGFSISLEGELDLDIGRQTEITVSNIRISGPDWANRQDLVAAGFLRVSLETSTLLKDTIVFESLQIDSLQLNLETRTDGVRNWIPVRKQPSKDSKAGGGPIVIFHKMQFNNSTLRYMNGRKGFEHVLHIASLDQQQQADGMLSIALDGTFNERPVEYTGTIGPYANLLQGTDIGYTAMGQFGNLSITGHGFIDDLLKPKRPQFKLEMQGPNIDEVTAMFGFDDLGSGSFTLRARGESVNEHYEADINGKIGDITLGVSAQVSELSKLDELDLKLAANGPSLGALTRSLGLEDWPDKPFSIKGDIDRIGGTLNISKLTLGLGGTELILDALLTNFPDLEASRIRLSVSGDDVEQFRELLGHTRYRNRAV